MLETCPRFSRYILRTSDVPAAMAFYDAVLGARGDGIVELAPAALARGARPHWLGVVGVGDLGGTEAAAARFVALGASRLGPPSGGDLAVLRDPGGAIVALSGTDRSSSAGVIWHQLHTNDAPRAAVHYRELFGWFALPDVDLGALGTHRPFAWRVGESAVGGIADVASRPGVHTHWTFFFDVPSLDAPLARIRELGGKVLGPSTLPDGTQVAACDDPQGAAFGLMRRPRKGA